MRSELSKVFLLFFDILEKTRWAKTVTNSKEKPLAELIWGYGANGKRLLALLRVPYPT